ncbi:MAG TPA: hypothetical protein VFD82_18650 [Planctomycetota bacterium]|nr:hypothetical protein [Planctomycetota bacterium]
MRHSLPCLVLFAALPAQTFVVDAAGGPGTHFTDIGTAVGAVPDGSLLLVRAGQYASFAISGKSLTILGELGVSMLGPTSSVTISSLGVGQRVAIHQLSSTLPSGGLTTVTCQGCAGEILLDHVRGGAFSELRLVAAQCAQVVLTHCILSSNPTAASLTASDVTLVDCSVASGHNTNPTAPLLQQPGLVQVGGRVQLTNCMVSATGSLFAATPAAVSMQGGSLRCDGATALHADFGFPALFGRAIDGVGTVRLDPSVVLAGAVPPIGPAIAATTVDLPALSVTGGTIGGATNAAMTGASGQLGVLWIGLPVPAVALPGSGDPLAVWNGLVLAAGVFGPSLTASVNVPSLPGLVGQAFGWQGLTFDAGGVLQLTNAYPFLLQ